MQIKAKSKNIADLRAFLEAERDRLRKEIASQDLTISEERAGYSNHMAEDATLVFEQGRNVGMRRSQQHMLAEVEDALKRIDDGSYGVCRHCGKTIDAARLRALPTASLCYSCQHHAESNGV